MPPEWTSGKRCSCRTGVEIRQGFRDVPRIHCSPSQINQVFMNTVTNAVHAMAGRSDRGVLMLHTAPEGDNPVPLEIQDNSCGRPKAALPRIFDPFVTTRAIGQGSGMGLAISHKIVEQHGGRIVVDTASPGR